MGTQLSPELGKGEGDIRKLHKLALQQLLTYTTIS